MREKPGFPGSLSQLGAPKQKARDYAEMCALVSQGAGGKESGNEWLSGFESKQEFLNLRELHKRVWLSVWDLLGSLGFTSYRKSGV